MRSYTLCIFVGVLFILGSCDERRVFENNMDMPDNDWYADSVAKFSFEIKSQAENYNVFLNIRNAISYPYANLYVHYYLYNTKGKAIADKLLRLPLFDKKTGKPFGNGLGDIFDHQFALLKNHKFAEPGTYRLEIKQYMRQDPVPFVMAVGIRVEKLKP